MREVVEERKWSRLDSTSYMGIQQRIRRVFRSEVEALQVEAAIRALPIDHRFQTNLQLADGTPVMMYGVTGYGTSPYGGG